jgi:hypothetical protein
MANGKRTDQIEITAAERRQKALDLRKQAQSYRAIATALGYSVGQAHADVQIALAELAELEHASAAEYRTMEEERLDAAAAAIWPKVTKGDLDAVHAWVRISESRRRMRGLDAPQKIAPTTPDGAAPYQAYIEFRTLLLQVLPIEHHALLAAALEALDNGQPTDSGSDNGA